MSQPAYTLGKVARGALQGYVGNDASKLRRNLGQTDRAFAEAEQSFFRRAGCMGLTPERMTDLRDHAWDMVVAASQFCESPIERMMLGPLLLANYDGFGSIPARMYLPKMEDIPPAADVLLIPQFAFVRYRLDLAVFAKDDVRGTKVVALECDGNDYHKDNLREQTRDAMFAAFNVTVVHATGKEIYRDPCAVAARVSNILVDWKAGG